MLKEDINVQLKPLYESLDLLLSKHYSLDESQKSSEKICVILIKVQIDPNMLFSSFVKFFSHFRLF